MDFGKISDKIQVSIKVLKNPIQKSKGEYTVPNTYNLYLTRKNSYK